MITQFRTQQICMLNRINKVNLTKCETKMMSAPPKPRDTEELCPMCKRPKRDHTPEETLACDRKMKEFENEKRGGIGIE